MSGATFTDEYPGQHILRYQQLGPEIRRLPSGRFKVYWSWGTAVGFGAGPNFKYKCVWRQPLHGFQTIEEAQTFLKLLPTKPEYPLGNGSSIPNRDFEFCSRCGVSYTPGNGLTEHKCGIGAVA